MAPRQHFLVVTYPAQGHINPSLHLAKHLARTTGSLVTFFTSVSGHRLFFPSDDDDHPVSDGPISYVPFSDGYDDGDRHNPAQFLSNFKAVGSSKLAALARSLADDGRPVTCIIYGFLLSWAANVARDLSIPSVLYWIQPATVFSIYYHYFHGYGGVISAHVKDLDFPVQLPGIPPEVRIRDLPSFFRDEPYTPVLHIFKELFSTLDREQPPRVLINTFTALETDALAAVGGYELELIPVGPLLPLSLFEDGGDGNGYMEWLDTKEERSVVYVSFGSISVVSKRQVEEMVRGLQECGRPYLWVLREDSRWKGVELVKEGDDRGMVVEWCSQLNVLSHKAVGCFVTHCGWNSTVESLVCGVPIVAVPQWADQGTNARLTEAAWGTGVRVEVDGDGVLQEKELVRCLGRVMAEGGEGKEMRRVSSMWKERALEAVRYGGSSNQNLRNFVEDMNKNERGASQIS